MLRIINRQLKTIDGSQGRLLFGGYARSTNDFADGAIRDSLRHSHVTLFVTTLCAGSDREPSFFGPFTGFHHFAAAHWIDSDGLLHKYMFAGFDGRIELDGTEVRRRSEDDDINLGSHDFLDPPFDWVNTHVSQ